MKLDPPKHLSREAKDVWRRVQAEFGITDGGGLVLLQSVCESIDRIRESRAILARDGLIVQDQAGRPKPHPAAGLERDARTQLHSALRLMKLAPEAVE